MIEAAGPPVKIAITIKLYADGSMKLEVSPNEMLGNRLALYGMMDVVKDMLHDAGIAQQQTVQPGSIEQMKALEKLNGGKPLKLV